VLVTYFNSNSYVLILTKKWLGLLFGWLFQKSGHPGVLHPSIASAPNFKTVGEKTNSKSLGSFSAKASPISNLFCAYI
jgi:hypothetical protein